MSRSRRGNAPIEPPKTPSNKKPKAKTDNIGVTVHAFFPNSPGGVAPVIQYELRKPDGTSETVDGKTLKARNLELLEDDYEEVNHHSAQKRLESLRAAKLVYAQSKNTPMVKLLEAVEEEILKKSRGETKRIKR